MKKTLVVVLIALMALTSAFAAKKNNTVSAVAGLNGIGAAYEMPVKILDKDMKAYAGLGLGAQFKPALTIGVLHDWTKVQIDKIVFPVKVGAELVTDFSSVSLLASARMTYDFKIDRTPFTAFAQAGLGLSIPFKLATNALVGVSYSF